MKQPPPPEALAAVPSPETVEAIPSASTNT